VAASIAEEAIRTEIAADLSLLPLLMVPVLLLLLELLLELLVELPLELEIDVFDPNGKVLTSTSGRTTFLPILPLPATTNFPSDGMPATTTCRRAGPGANIVGEGSCWTYNRTPPLSSVLWFH